MINYSNIKIYVDDVRKAPEGYVWTKSVNETIAFIEEVESHGGSIDVIDLDHDMGEYASDGGDADRQEVRLSCLIEL